MATSKRSDNSWVEALDSFTDPTKRPKGEGWKTVDELKELMGCGVNQLYKKIGVGLKAGKLERFSGAEMGNCGRMTRRVWYRLK